MPKTKIAYTATLPDGTVQKFNSTRVYTHAVWVNADPTRDGRTGQAVVKLTANPAAGMKNPGQSGDQSRYFRSLGHGVVELTVG